MNCTTGEICGELTLQANVKEAGLYRPLLHLIQQFSEKFLTWGFSGSVLRSEFVKPLIFLG